MLGVNVGRMVEHAVNSDYYTSDEVSMLNDFIEGMMQEKSITGKVFTQSQVDGIMNAVLNLGMTLRQDQMNGYERRSGDEVLENWKKENLERLIENSAEVKNPSNQTEKETITENHRLTKYP